MTEILESNGSKLFQVLPLRTNIIPKHIILDTTTLKQFMYGVTRPNDQIWPLFLKMNNKVFRHKDYEFYNQIQTDGISCSLLFIKKNLSNKRWGEKLPVVPEVSYDYIEAYSINELEYILRSEINIVGCDPGKKSLVYMIDKNGNHLEYNSYQRQVESKAKRNQRILLKEKKRNNISEMEDVLSEYNSKTVNYDLFKYYIIAKNNLNNQTRNFYGHPLFRKMKLRSFIYSRKSVDNFLNKIKDTFGDNILIG
jgi:hypothetical protein